MITYLILLLPLGQLGLTSILTKKVVVPPIANRRAEQEPHVKPHLQRRCRCHLPELPADLLTLPLLEPRQQELAAPLHGAHAVALARILGLLLVLTGWRVGLVLGRCTLAPTIVTDLLALQRHHRWLAGPYGLQRLADRQFSDHGIIDDHDRAVIDREMRDLAKTPP